MSGDIEEFLRRAAERRARQQSQRPPQRTVETLRAEVIEEAEVVEDDIAHGRSVQEHVAQHIKSGVFDQRTAQLGEEVDQADDRMEAHLQQYFVHELGDLGARTSAAEDSILDDDSPVKPGASIGPEDFLEFLKSPESVRQAIVLREVFDRPTWW